MDLYIVRHAWAEERDARRWPNDDLRPLLPEGEERFAGVVKKLLDRGFAPTLLATSPLVRCRQTAIIAAGLLAGPPQVVELDSLRPDSDLERLIAWTAGQTAHEAIAWVGHSPDVDQMTVDLLGDAMGQIRFAKGAVAALRFDGPPAVGEAELRWFVTAKVLGC